MLFSRQLPNFLRSCRSTLIPLWLFFAFVGNRVAAAPVAGELLFRLPQVM